MDTGRLNLKAGRVLAALIQEYGERVWNPRGDPLSELMETILSQHTSDLNSHRAFTALKGAFSSWTEVRDTNVEAVAKAIHSAGLSKIKAPRIQRVLQEISPIGEPNLEFLKAMPRGKARGYLMALPGVGPKTAACVLLFSLGMPAIPVDTHVHRVALRLGLIGEKTPADAAHDKLEELVPEEAMYPFHMNIVAHGRQVCHAQRPAHEICVLRSECDFWSRLTI
jgi:endonuclease-3